MPNDIKISTQFDTASFRTVDNAIKGLINTVNNLNKSIENVSRSVSKIQTGGIQQGNFSSIKTSSQGKKGGIVEAILGTGEASSMGRMVSETDRAFDNISRKITSFTSKAVSDMGKLNSVIGGKGGAGWSTRMMGELEERSFARAGGIIGRPTQETPGYSGGPFSTTSEGMTPSGARANPIVPSTNSGGKGRGGGGGGWGSSMVSGFAGGVENLASGNISGFLGSTLGKLGVVGAIGYGAYRTADALSNMGTSVLSSNIDYKTNFPLKQEQAVGSVLAPFKAYGQNIMGRNFRNIYGFESAIGSPAGKALMDVVLKQRMVDVKVGDTTLSGLIKNRISQVSDSTTQKVMDLSGEGRSSFSKAISSGLSIVSPLLGAAYGLSTFHKRESGAIEDAKSRYDIKRQNAERSVPIEMAEQVSELAEAKTKQLNSLESYYLDAYSGSGAMSRVKTLRASGLGTRPVKFKDGTEASSYEWHEANLMAKGRDYGDKSAAYHQFLSIGQGYRKTFGEFEFMSASEAGFGNLSSLAKTYGTLTGSNSGSRALINGINGAGGLTGGTGGLDVAVARDLFQDLAQSAMSSGMYGGSGLSQVNRMMGTFVGAGGADVATQQRNAWAYGLGGQLEKTYTSGSRSAFDKVASWQDAINGTKGVFDAGTIRLREMGATDPRLLASIAYGGAKVPMWAEGLIDKSSAQGYFESKRLRPFATILDEQFKNRPLQAGLLRQLREQGSDPAKLISSMVHGKVGSTKWFNSQWEASVRLGGILGGNKVANAGMISEEFLRTQKLERPSGPGAHSANPQDLEGIVLKNAKSYQREVAIAMRNGKSISSEAKDAIAKKYGLGDHLIAEQRLQKQGGDIPSLSDAFVKAATDLANAIKQKAPSSPRKGAAP